MADPSFLALAAAVGVAGGLASGLFGVGGGVILVPAAIFLLDHGYFDAKAASLFVITAVALLGVREHAKAGHVRLALGVLLAAGGIGGSILAVHLAESVGEGPMRALFGVLLAFAGVRLWFEVRAREPGPRAVWLVAPGVGFAAGLLAGFFGIGGGILMVPAMVLLGLPVHAAVGTSLVPVFLNSAAGTAAHLQLGYGEAMAALGLPLAAGSAVGIVAGARLAGRLPAHRLRRAFGVFLALVGGAMALTSG